MSAILDWSQQFISPFLAFWPIWLAFTVVWWISKFNRFTFGEKFGKYFLMGTLGIFLVVRVLVFVVFPYGDINEQFEVLPKEDASRTIVITHDTGKLALNYDDGAQLRHQGKDLKGQKKFARTEYTTTGYAEKIEKYDALYFDTFSAMHILGTVYADTTVKIPRTAEQNLYILVQKTDAVLDLSECRATKIDVTGIYSRVRLVLPRNALNQQIQVRLWTSPAEIQYNNATAVEFLDYSRSARKLWEDLDNVKGDYYAYDNAAAKQSEKKVSVHVITASLSQLVLRKISGNNDQ